MLQQMRQNTKAILWVVVIAFVVTIFAVWGLDLQTGQTTSDPTIVGKVNGIPISRAQYQFAYQQFAQQIRGSSPNQSLTYAQEQFVREQAWESIVYGIVTDEQIKALGIRVSDQELVDYLRASPPPEIRQYFIDDQGQFDNQAYQTALNNPEVDWTSLEQLARDRILRIKLNEYLAAQVHVSEEEVKREYVAESIDMSLKYVEFPIAAIDLADYTPSAEEIAEYYDEHKTEFAEPETREVKLIRIPLTPSRADIDDAVFTVGRLRDQIAAGEDFVELAQTFSEAPTSFVGGSTGFVSRGSRGSQYFDALDRLQPDELSDVVVTDEGIYLLRLVETQTGDDGELEYSAQEILVAPILSRQSSDSLYDIATLVIESAAQTDLETAAGEKGLEVLSTPLFAKNGPIGNLGIIASVNDFAFANEPGALSDWLRDDDNIYVAQVVAANPEGIKPVNEVTPMIGQLLILDKKRSVAERDAGAFFQKAQSTDFQTAVDTYSLTAKETGTFRAQDNIDPFGPHSQVAELALSIAPGEVGPPIESRMSLVVVNLLSRGTIDPEDYQARTPAIRQRVLQRKVQVYSQAWYETLSTEADIEDYRSQQG